MAESADLQAVLARFPPQLAAEQRLDGQRQKVSRRIGQCRTPALGGMHWQCERCADGWRACCARPRVPARSRA